jgi:hypothetical protein
MGQGVRWMERNSTLIMFPPNPSFS